MRTAAGPERVKPPSGQELPRRRSRQLVGTDLRPIVNQRINPSQGNSNAMSTHTALAVPEATRSRAILTTVMTNGMIQTMERMIKCHPFRLLSTASVWHTGIGPDSVLRRPREDHLRGAIVAVSDRLSSGRDGLAAAQPPHGGGSLVVYP